MNEPIAEHAPTERFSGRASDYVAGRPGYPPESLDVLFAGLGAPETLTVADLGAGTGISSRLLAARGARVIALEPNAAMRDHAEAAANVTWSAGTARRNRTRSGVDRSRHGVSGVSLVQARRDAP